MFPIVFSRSTCQLLFYKNIESFKDDKKSSDFTCSGTFIADFVKKDCFSNLHPTNSTNRLSERRFTLKKSVQKMPKRSWFFVGLVLCAAGVLLLLHSPWVAADSKKKVEHQQAFAVYQKKCLGCHDSVADPEKPGRTRDEWFLVVNVMHGYGMDLTDQETQAITDLLYDLRKGLEKEAG
jgi:hypothetical protein